MTTKSEGTHLVQLTGEDYEWKPGMSPIFQPGLLAAFWWRLQPASSVGGEGSSMTTKSEGTQLVELTGEDYEWKPGMSPIFQPGLLAAF